MWRTKWLIFRKNVDWKSRIWVRNCRLLWQRKLGHRAGHVISVFAVSYLKWPHWSPHWVFNSAHAKCMMNQSTIWKCRKCLTYWHAYVKRFTIFVSWKPIVITLGAEKSIFPELSPAKRSRSGPNSVYVNMSRGDNIQGILGAIGPFWAKRGLGRVPRSQSLFLCGNPEDLSATRQRPIFTKFGHET